MIVATVRVGRYAVFSREKPGVQPSPQEFLGPGGRKFKSCRPDTAGREGRLSDSRPDLFCRELLAVAIEARHAHFIAARMRCRLWPMVRCLNNGPLSGTTSRQLHFWI